MSTSTACIVHSALVTLKEEEGGTGCFYTWFAGVVLLVGRCVASEGVLMVLHIACICRVGGYI